VTPPHKTSNFFKESKVSFHKEGASKTIGKTNKTTIEITHGSCTKDKLNKKLKKYHRF
jgi:hypothetical protein